MCVDRSLTGLQFSGLWNDYNLWELLLNTVFAGSGAQGEHQAVGFLHSEWGGRLPHRGNLRDSPEEDAAVSEDPDCPVASCQGLILPWLRLSLDVDGRYVASVSHGAPSSWVTLSTSCRSRESPVRR